MLKIPPDATVLVQIAIFVVLWVALKRLWFDPALRIIKERDARSEGAVAEARAIQAEAEKLRAEHARALDEARAEAQREMQAIIHGAEVEQKRMVDEATADTKRMLADASARVAEEVAAARRNLQA